MGFTTYKVSLHLLNLDFDCIQGLAEQLALLYYWEGHCGGGSSRQSR